MINKMGIKENLRNIFKPLFQDYTKEGRIIGFLLRVARILFWIILYAVILFTFLLFYLISLALPAILILNLIGGLFGTKPTV